MKRQGDLLIVKVSDIPARAIVNPHRVLAEGEKTGHRHELSAGTVYQSRNRLFFQVPEGPEVTLLHPEHEKITFTPGIYRVIRQREYQPGGWKYAAD